MVYFLFRLQSVRVTLLTVYTCICIYTYTYMLLCACVRVVNNLPIHCTSHCRSWLSSCVARARADGCGFQNSSAFPFKGYLPSESLTSVCVHSCFRQDCVAIIICINHPYAGFHVIWYEHTILMIFMLLVVDS